MTEINQLRCGGETSPANCNFQVLSATHFSADSVRCQCIITLVWQFVLAEQMNNAEFRESVGRVNREHSLHKWTSVSRTFWTRKGYLFHWQYFCLVSGSYYLWLSSKEILFYFQASLLMSGTCRHIPPASRWTGGARIWRQSDTFKLPVRMLRTDPDDIAIVLASSRIVILQF